MLQLLSDADVGDDTKIENFSLKSVAELLYQQQEHTDTEHNNIVDSDDIADSTDGPAAAIAVTSSATDFGQTYVSSSSCISPLCLSPSVEASRSVVMDGTYSRDRSVPFRVNNCVRIPSQNVQHSQDTCVPTSSFRAPFFCIPTLPVLSASAVSMHTGRRRSQEQICDAAGQSACSDGSEQTVDTSPSILLTNARDIPAVVSTCCCASTPNVQCSCSASPSVPSFSVSNARCTLQQTVSSHSNSKTLTTTSEAVSRISELLSSKCRVLVLMRGCPGSGKTTMARYVFV